LPLLSVFFFIRLQFAIQLEIPPDRFLILALPLPLISLALQAGGIRIVRGL
jgi:hypothetical protein